MINNKEKAALLPLMDLNKKHFAQRSPTY